MCVTDLSNNRTRAVSLQSGAVSTIAGGAAGFRDGCGTAALLSSPVGIAVGPGGSSLLGTAPTTVCASWCARLALQALTAAVAPLGEPVSGGGSLLSPEDVAYSPSGALVYISTGSAGDPYHYVLSLALSGPLAGTVNLVAGSGTAGGADAASGPAAR